VELASRFLLSSFYEADSAPCLRVFEVAAREATVATLPSFVFALCKDNEQSALFLSLWEGKGDFSSFKRPTTLPSLSGSRLRLAMALGFALSGVRLIFVNTENFVDRFDVHGRCAEAFAEFYFEDQQFPVYGDVVFVLYELDKFDLGVFFHSELGGRRCVRLCCGRSVCGCCCQKF
jgi:hypothetical protein